VSVSRRDFVKAAGGGGLAALAGGAWSATQSVDPVTSVDNPLRSYPNRDWEEVYAHREYSSIHPVVAQRHYRGIDQHV